MVVFSCSRIIWLGDLNYRIALSYRAAKALVEMRNWRALLEKDQVNVETWFYFCRYKVESVTNQVYTNAASDRTKKGTRV